MVSLPTFFISHGGGPWPYMKSELGGAYDQLEASLKDIPNQLSVAPRALLVVSAHWEERDFSVMSGPKPPMLYDYSGFPEHTYRVHYSAPGSIEVAGKVQALIRSAGFPCGEDAERGFDHGTFSPLAVIYPEAKIPVVQLSIRSDYDPEAHIRLGRAIASLREDRILIVGSGLSYHNLRRFGGPFAKKASGEFDRWLGETLLESASDERTRRLIHWAEAPSARDAHPQEDHLIPLMVAVGAAEGEKADVIYHENAFMGDITVSSYRFGR